MAYSGRQWSWGFEDQAAVRPGRKAAEEASPSGDQQAAHPQVLDTGEDK